MVAVALLVAWGCTAPNPGKTQPRPASKLVADKATSHGTAPRTSPTLSATDPCAERLHELSGSLLFYYAKHRRLPNDLAQLEALDSPAGDDVALACPVSEAPYVYDPEGLPRPANQPGLIIVYDPHPSHAGLRWAVVMEPGGRAGPPITRVIAAPESHVATPAGASNPGAGGDDDGSP